MLDDALLLLLGQEVPNAEAVKGLGAVVAQVVQQVKVKIPGSRALQRGGQHRAGLLGGLGPGPSGQLGGQLEALARIAVHKGGLDRLFALALQIAVGRVKIGKALGQEKVHHLLGLLDIHFAVHHGQAHQAEAEFFNLFTQISHV